ncbi:hypothetical protein SFK304_2865 [Shigella flexneri K-304]|nr:hypothetical protein SFK304_2865 [Shigella flexneri K-304]
MLLSGFLWLKNASLDHHQALQQQAWMDYPTNKTLHFFVELLALDNVNFLAVPA